MKQEDEIRSALQVFGFDLVNVVGELGYGDRKGKCFAIVHGDQVLCTYATLPQIKAWVVRRLLPSSSIIR